jgi:hypothetical protein
MATTEEVVKAFKAQRIAKFEAMGLEAVCKIAVTAPDALLLDEHEFTALSTRAAQKEHPSMRADAAFAKIYTEQSERGTLLRKATSAMKGMATLEPTSEVVNDPGDVAVTYEELQRLADAQRRERDVTPAQAFAAVLADPKNKELAAQALRRPEPTTLFGRVRGRLLGT